MLLLGDVNLKVTDPIPFVHLNNLIVAPPRLLRVKLIIGLLYLIKQKINYSTIKKHFILC